METFIGDDPETKYDIQKRWMDYVFWLEGVPHFAFWGWWYIYEAIWALLTYWTWYYPQLKPGNSDEIFSNKKFSNALTRMRT